jgi:hypothetical protein
MQRRSVQHLTILTVASIAAIASGCGPRQARPPIANTAPGGRGTSVQSASPPKSYYERQADATSAYAVAPRREQQPVQTFDTPATQHTQPVQPPPSSPGFVGKQVSIHFTASSLSLGTGPRRDIVKGKVLSADTEWLVLQVENSDKPLYIPRTSVMAIQVE